uniref:Corticotropin-releasing factor-binding protein-like n=2 Tax=Hirondellea gigas TaxID=1518452 RepID=A0A2P2I7J3_9CRUS
MFVFLLAACCLVGMAPQTAAAKVAFPKGGPSTVMGLGLQALRNKRSSQLIKDCISVGLEEGGYYHKSVGDPTVCGVYLASGPSQRVQITLDYLDIDCKSGGLISFLDGWELNGEVFPPTADVPMEGRVEELCGRHRRKVFVSSSNAASLLYTLPRRGDVFKFSVKFIKHPTPCNILVNGDSGVFTLRNHGTRINCSLAAVFPASISLLQLSVGVPAIRGIRRAAPNRFIETGVMHRCSKRGLEDEVVVGGSLGLDVSNMVVEDDICGLDSNPRGRPSSVLCEVSVVRLISSGNTENSVTVAVSQLQFEDPNMIPTTVCPMPNEA